MSGLSELIGSSVENYPFSNQKSPVFVLVDSKEPGVQGNLGLAYDVGYDVRRYEELREDFGDGKARELLVEEMSVDLLTHFGELGGESGRIGYFSYRYLVDESGELVEDSAAKKPIREMFRDQDGVVADLWLNWMIPFLEEAPVGAGAFVLSSKRDGVYEGKYDYAYYFQKSGSDKVMCSGLELDLSKEEQVEIFNRQYKRNGHYQMFLGEKSDSNEIRRRALFYPASHFVSATQAYSEIVGEVLSEMRVNNRLDGEEDFENYFKSERRRLYEKQGWVEHLAENMASGIAAGFSPVSLQESLSQVQLRELNLLDPDILRRVGLSGVNEIRLPCGIVMVSNSGNSIEFDLRKTAGDNLVEGSVSKMKCVECPFCHKTVDAIVTSSKIKCPECKNEAKK